MHIVFLIILLESGIDLEVLKFMESRHFDRLVTNSDLPIGIQVELEYRMKIWQRLNVSYKQKLYSI